MWIKVNAVVSDKFGVALFLSDFDPVSEGVSDHSEENVYDVLHFEKGQRGFKKGPNYPRVRI